MIITWSSHHIVIPGTTPLVAMALIEMAVSKVCKSNIATHPKTQPLPLTQQQHSKMMTSDCITPALPTIQVSLRNNITPRIFCSVGRYTPIIVPILTCDTQGYQWHTGISDTQGYHWHTGISLTHRGITDTRGYQHRSLTIHGIPVTSMLIYRFFCLHIVLLWALESSNHLYWSWDKYCILLIIHSVRCSMYFTFIPEKLFAVTSFYKLS